MQSAFIATCPNSNEAVIVVLGVTTVSEFRAAAAAQGLIRTCDDEEGYEFYKPLQAWAVLTPEGTWDLGASSDAPDALPAMVATARWVSITSCQCEACPVNEGTHKPAGALLQIDEPKSSVNQVDEAINSLLRAALIEGGCSAERVIEAREETNLRRAELRTLLSTPQPCSRSHPHEEMTPMCELRTEIARLTNALARAEAQLAAAQQAVQGMEAEIQQAVEAERERICAAIKAEDDHCVDQGDYMLDSNDCIKIVRGKWVRPDYSVDAVQAKQGEQP